MMDYAAWTKRASRFLRGLTHLPGVINITDGIKPASTDDYTVEWLESAKCSLPLELKDFLATASHQCYFRYAWKPPELSGTSFEEIYPGQPTVSGGGNLCEASGYSNYDSRDWFASEPEVLGSLGKLLSASAKVNDPARAFGRIPILTLAGGDQISVLAEHAESGGKVVYIHAGDIERVQELSGTFDEFLVNWERIAYLTPSLDNLRPWLNPKTGVLEPDEEKAARFREVFTVPSNPERSVE